MASDPVVSRLVTRLAADAPRALKAIRAARAAARQRAWALAGDAAPGADGALIPVDIDATIVTACSEKEQAAPTWKKTFGFHPLTVFADHGPGRPGRAAGHRAAPGQRRVEHRRRPHRGARLALAQLPRQLRRRVLIRTDSGGGTHEFLAWLPSPGRRLAYSVGFTITEDIAGRHPGRSPPGPGPRPMTATGRSAPGAWVAELTGMLDLAAWPEGCG